MAEEKHKPGEEQAAHGHPVSTTTKILGITVPVTVYTVVFVILGILTVIEVVIGTSSAGDVRIPVLLALALAKATLVVLYYMHLRTDSRIFAYTLMLPLFIAIAAMLYLLSIPPTGY